MNNKITVETVVTSSPKKVWKFWNDPKHITKWAFASDEWECPRAENDLKVDGKFLTRMSAKDSKESFDITGVYTRVISHKKIEYRMDDGRMVSIDFQKMENDSAKIIQTFEMENENTEEVQRGGWQTILNNFKKYAENN